MTGVCGSGPACVGRDPETDPFLLVDESFLCAGCQLAAARDIRALILDYRDLEQLIPPSSGGMTTRVAGTAEARVPLNLHIDALQRSIVWALTTWEPPVRAAAGLSPERVAGVRPGRAVQVAVSVIAPRVALLASLPPIVGYADGPESPPVARSGLEAVQALRGMHRACLVALGLTQAVLRLPGDCGSCGAAMLVRDAGSDTVRCGSCDDRRTYDDYRRYVGRLLADVPRPRKTP